MIENRILGNSQQPSIESRLREVNTKITKYPIMNTLILFWSQTTGDEKSLSYHAHTDAGLPCPVHLLLEF
jgi:hypothetical protein